MSLEYRNMYPDLISTKKITSKEMREYCQRPGEVDNEGNIVYFTQQNHKNECDVNNIIKKYDKTGLILHVSKIEAQFGDLTGFDFKQSLDMINNASTMFMELPSNIRKHFNNSPIDFLDFMDNPDNREEAIKLGLIKGEWTPETDGLGEHITDDSQRKTNKPETEPAPE